jgi:hypothetical protein
MIEYRKGYKYQLAKDYIVLTEIFGYKFDSQFLKLTKDGVLLIRSGYSWDGPSGPTIDRRENREGSLPHDGIYQMLRNNVFHKNEHERIRLYADKLMVDINLQKGMWVLTAKLYKYGVGDFAAFAADPKNKKKIYME